MSAADRPSEYLKRTCLICGCNTNQTINIYEPRSGPNIVELIQAKFKFQPLNEDKYLCFSCNNWLINWHSLQANSNDAESPSGTFRSSQVNGGMAQEKRAQQSQQQQSSPPQQKQQYQQQRQKQLQQNIAVCRPIAQVRPRHLIEADEQQQRPEEKSSEASTSVPKYQNEYPIIAATAAPRKHNKHSYAKRTHNTTYRHRHATKKALSHCCVCGRSIVFCIRSAIGTLRQLSKPKRTAKCRKCRSVCQWRSIYMRSLTKDRTNSSNAIQYRPLVETAAPQSLVSQVESTSKYAATLHEVPRNQSQHLKRPLVDGKVVAMLRRLGTTLSREQHVLNNVQQLPPIMSPTKPKPRWTRPLEADEILLHFETAISEVLPIVDGSVSASTKQTPTRRKLTYQVSCGSECETHTKTATCMTTAYQNIFNSLPKGLDISLV